MENIIIDTGFWFALIDSTDEHHNKALEIDKLINIQGNRVIIPFPTLYETINTAFSSNKNWMIGFEEIINNPDVVKFPDDLYRDDALEISFKTSLNQNRNLSLTDVIIRLMLDDPNNKIDYLVTFNVKDFHDVCQRKNIEILFD